MRSSFAVVYRLFAEEKTEVVLGVTSIVPNLSGLLFFTEDKEDHQIELYRMNGGFMRLAVDYEQEWYLSFRGNDAYHIHDHRNR